MPIIINGTTLGSSASINGTSLNTVKFNGTTVWEAISPEIEISLSSAMTATAKSPGTSKTVPSSSTYSSLFNMLSQSIDLSKFTYFQLHYRCTMKANYNYASNASIYYKPSSKALLHLSQYSASELTQTGYTDKQLISKAGNCEIRLRASAAADNGYCSIKIDYIKFTND